MTKAIICDLDGCLALLNGRDPFKAETCDQDLLNEPVASVVRWAYDSGLKIIFLSGRQAKHSEPTIKFLEKYGFYAKDGEHIPGYFLHMRTTGDFRKDSIIKRELYEKYVLGKYDVLFILDDRKQVVDMWRLAYGLTVFQVAEGKF
jgi:hypothetical protein